MMGGSGRRTQHGVTLVELVVAIVIISTAVVAVIGVLSLTAGRSADPLLARQSLAAAEALLAEVLSQPFTTLDADGGANAIGPEAGESRHSSSAPFDHIDDYHGLALTGISSADGTAIALLAGYAASISVQQQALGNVPAGDGLLVTVTVTDPAGVALSLSGYRARLAP
jgi:MSHA pilin protein MshD